jgi:Ca-activated chloride channel family protein
MKRLMIPVLILVALFLGACGQSAEKLNNVGNEAFENQEYESALMAYHQAGEDSPELAEPHYNAANTHYRLEDYEQALQQIEAALVSEESGDQLDQYSFYNLGNTFFQGQQFDTAVEAYKEALRLNPDDLEAKQNLELALRQMQQQQQDQQQQEQEQQDQQDQEEQQDEQQQSEEQQDSQQDEQQQDQQSEEQQDQQGEEQQDQQSEEQQDQQEQQQDPQDGDGEPQEDQQQDGQANGQPQQLEGLTEEQARQLFEAAAQDTESLEEFLQQVLVSPMAPPAEDW